MEKTIKILHFERNENNAEYVESNLVSKKMKCEFRRVFNSESFQNALRTDLFDIILCDNTMPEIDWASAVKFAHEISPHSSLLFLSADYKDTPVSNSLSTSSVNPIPRFKIQDLIPAIDKVLETDSEANFINSYWG